MDVATRLGRLHITVTGAGEPIVIAVDPPGHGPSSPLDRGFTFDECAQCVVDILDHQ